MIKKVAKKPAKKTKTSYVVLMDGSCDDLNVILPFHYSIGETGFDTVDEAMAALRDLVGEDFKYYEGEDTVFTIAAIAADVISVKALPQQFELVVNKGD